MNKIESLIDMLSDHFISVLMVVTTIALLLVSITIFLTFFTPQLLVNYFIIGIIFGVSLLLTTMSIWATIDHFKPTKTY